MKNINSFFKIGKWYKVKKVIGFSTTIIEEKIILDCNSNFLLLTCPKKDLSSWDEHYFMKILYENKAYTILFGDHSHFTDNLDSFLKKIS